MKKTLHAPLKKEDLNDLRTGDVVYYSGIVVTGRDDVHQRVVKEGMKCPVDLNGLALFHTGPLVRETDTGNYMVALGPTTSIRMEQEESDFIDITGVKLIIGKGAMGPKTAEACKIHGTIHCVYPGGCAVIAAECVKEIGDVKWRELGMPECMWVMEVENLGPLIVSIDTKGNNLFEECKEYYKSQKQNYLDYTKAKIRNLLHNEGEKQ